MFSVIFPGQGSQIVGMGKEFYDKFDLVKNLFKEADETLNFSISTIRPCMVLYILLLGAFVTGILYLLVITYHLKNSV